MSDPFKSNFIPSAHKNAYFNVGQTFIEIILKYEFIRIHFDLKHWYIFFGDNIWAHTYMHI